MKITELLLDKQQAILDAPMNEMANLFPPKTGLATAVWFGEVGGQHGPRIKVSNVPGKFAAYDNFVISVSRQPNILTPKSVKLNQSKINDIFDWVKLNYDTLMELWRIHESGDEDNEYDSIIAQLQKI